MNEKMAKLKVLFEQLFGESYINNCLIEVEDKKDEIVLSANTEGMIYLIRELIELCVYNKEWGHYHLDEAGMANKSNKPLVISFVKGD